jgi:hypothetical protein
VDMNMLPFVSFLDEVSIFKYTSTSYSRELADSIFSIHCSASARYYHQCSPIYGHVFSGKENIDIALRLFGRYAWKSDYEGKKLDNSFNFNPVSYERMMSELITTLNIRKVSEIANPFRFTFPNNSEIKSDDNLNLLNSPLKTSGHAVRRNTLSESEFIIGFNSFT